jgi:hypothetical protein
MRQKKKLGFLSKGRKFDEETNKQKTAHLIGKPKSAEVRAKISATLSGEGNYWYGKKRTRSWSKSKPPCIS